MRRLASILLLISFLFAGTASASVYPASASFSTLTTPSGAIRTFYSAINHHNLAFAYKLLGSYGSPTFQSFLARYRSVVRATVHDLQVAGYRIFAPGRVFTCASIRVTYTSARFGHAGALGGWYLLSKAGSGRWLILLGGSHVIAGGGAVLPSRTACASRLPSSTSTPSNTIVGPVNFLTRRIGWVEQSASPEYVPDGGCSYGSGSGCNTAVNTLLYTADGGANWQARLRFTGPPLAGESWLRVFDSDDIAVAGVTAQGPVLFQTHDAGLHWTRYLLPRSTQVSAGLLTFLTPRLGWLLVQRNAVMGTEAVDVFHTDTGGASWSLVSCVSRPGPAVSTPCSRPSGLRLIGYKTIITFRNPQTGSIIATENSGRPDLYRSDSAGRSWRTVHLPAIDARHFLSASSRTPDLFITYGTPHFFSQGASVLGATINVCCHRPGPTRTGTAQLSTNFFAVYRSSDSGAHWSRSLLSPVRAPFGTPLHSQLLDPLHWWVGYNNTLLRTSNGGRSWSRWNARLPSGLTLVTLDFVDPQHGSALAVDSRQTTGSGTGNALLRTSDGGIHWSVVTLPTAG